MKVLMLTTNLDLPEAHLILGLRNSGVKIKLVMHQNSPFQDVVRDSGIEIVYWNFKGRIDLKSVFFIRTLLSRESYDIIHTFSARSLTSALLASIFNPVKHVTYRGTTGHLSKLDPSSWLGYLNPKVSKIICVSDAVKKYLLGQGISAEKLIRIYKGHREDWYTKYANLTRQDFGIGESEFLVACSANMRPVKGVDLLVKAFEYIPSDLNIRAILVGEVRDEEINKLLSRPEIKKRFFLTGFRNDAAQIVSLCDAFCMPSRKREGLPKALIEAMIQAVPAVITNVGGMPELISNGVHGLVVSEENPEQIAGAIISLYNNREYSAKLGKAARERIIKEFTIEKTIDETLKVYQELIPGVQPAETRSGLKNT